MEDERYMPWGRTQLESYCRRLPREDHPLRANTGNKCQRMSGHLRTCPNDLLELIQRFETQSVIYSQLMGLLKNDPNLKEIKLTGIGIGDHDAKALAQALQTNTSLEKVDLTGNKIDDDAAKALREDTRSRPWGPTQLKKHCELLNAKALAQALQTNTSLEKVDSAPPRTNRRWSQKPSRPW